MTFDFRIINTLGSIIVREVDRRRFAILARSKWWFLAQTTKLEQLLYWVGSSLLSKVLSKSCPLLTC